MGVLEIKSKFNAEFRRFSDDSGLIPTFQDFYKSLESMHGLSNVKFIIQYVDPVEHTLLPINNDKNCERAFKVAKNPLRILIQLKGASYGEIVGYKPPNNVFMRKKPAALVRSIGAETPELGQKFIKLGDDFHKVSSIIDDGTVPECMRRVNLLRTDSKPLGFCIRDGFSIRTTPEGVQHVPGIFISRILPGGLAESTGLLAVKDEIIEVNGIEVSGKSLDQVTDMMVANSSNLIVTVKPINQKTCVHRNVPPNRVSSMLVHNSPMPFGNSPRSSAAGAHSSTFINETPLQKTMVGGLRNSGMGVRDSNRRSVEHREPITEEPGVIDI